MHGLFGSGGGCDGAKQKTSKEQRPMRLNARQVLWKWAEVTHLGDLLRSRWHQFMVLLVLG